MTKKEKELYKKYDDIIAFIEMTKLNIKAVLNFIIFNYDRIEVSQDALRIITMTKLEKNTEFVQELQYCCKEGTKSGLLCAINTVKELKEQNITDIDSVLKTLEQTGILLIFIFTGYFLRKKDIINESGKKVLAGRGEKIHLCSLPPKFCKI